VARPADAIARDRLQRLGVAVGEELFFEPAGCAFCDQQGYAGRQPVAELLVMSPRLRQAVHDRRPTEELHALSIDEGMTPLLSAAMERAREGTTSLAEVLRVVG
jgi:type II secretory ATPase GspE/PulE/Tfp pilus assembly ATPase PilB-like protein